MTIFRAATKPLNLAMLTVAVVAGLTIAWWLLPVGVVAYALLVALTWREHVLLPPAPPPLPTLAHDNVFAPQLHALARTRDEIAQSVAAAATPLRTTLTRVTQQVDSIVNEGHHLADKGHTIAAYLRQVDRPGLEQQQREIEQQIAATTDAPLREQYTATQHALREQVSHAEALELYLQRIRAQFDTINVSLDNVLAETVRLRTAPALDVSPSADTVAARLADLRADMRALGQVLDTALTGVA